MGKHIEIRLALPVVGPLVDFILPLLDAGEGDLPASPDLDAVDHELRESWEEELIAAHDSDIEFFKGLFGEEFHETGVIEFPEEASETVVRACSTVRLKLRAGVLGDIEDSAIEGGELDFDSLSIEEKSGFMAYSFLATFQEILIRHMDPGIGEG